MNGNDVRIGRGGHPCRHGHAGQEPLVRPRPFRTASVIIESGARVRRNVTLAPVDELPFEEDERSSLLDHSATSGTGYSISCGIATRERFLSKPSLQDKFVTWIRSENPKRFDSWMNIPLMTGY